METTRNHPHQNVLVTRTKVKTLYKQQTNLDLWNTTLGYGFHFQHKNSRMFPIESVVHDSGHTLACAKYGYPKGSRGRDVHSLDGYLHVINTVKQQEIST
jgi:hypothetical protein